ncbi:MAG: arginase family protein, partial [Chitinophagaceae bacterium]|nr:arginase family protein [Chitinophagaceae bacterium]
MKDIFNFISPIHFSQTEDVQYQPTQIGKHIQIINEANADLDNLDLIIIGCGEFRGQDRSMAYSEGPDLIRKEFYQLHYWHPNVKIGDIGNIIEGKTQNDTKAALKTVLIELYELGKKVLVLGGSHDLTIQQYDVFRQKNKIIDFTVVDMLADLEYTSDNRYDSYLMESLMQSPNYVRHFNLIGFQSYFVNPKLIETFDRLCFDCIRVGKAREDLDQIEPAFRGSHLVSIDINAVRFSDAPANKMASPNGFYGDEMCKITRFAGMSSDLSTLGIYGYRPETDEVVTPKLIAQMIWYFIDGLAIAKIESPLTHLDQFLEYQITFTDNNTLFLKSKRTNRWWMKLAIDNFTPCTQKDYITACNNEIPERWLRENERMV